MKKKIIQMLLLLAAAALCLWLAGNLSAQELEGVIAACGGWAAPAYVLLFTLLPVFFFPVAVLALAGGVLFGLWRGSVYTFIGAVLNCSLMFALSRRVGRQRMEELLRRRLSPAWQRRFDRLEGRDGFLLLIVLRLIPAVPYNLINYAFGLVGMSFGSYLLASAIGIIPGTLVFINLGDKAAQVGSAEFWMAVGLLALLLVVTTLLGRCLFPKEHDENDREKNNEKEKCKCK